MHYDVRMIAFEADHTTLFGADFNASATAGAFVISPKKLGQYTVSLGIVAPQTPQRASFQEYRGSDTGAVIKTVSLYG